MKTVTQYIVWGLGVATAVLLIYMMWDHKGESRAQAQDIIKTMKDNSSDTVAALKEIAAADRMHAASIRFQTCIMAMNANEKKTELLDENSLCHQMERIQ